MTKDVTKDVTKKTYTAAECAAMIKNALNESVANGTSPEIKLLKLVAELEGNYATEADFAPGDTMAGPEPPAGSATDSDPAHVLIVSGEPVDGVVDPVPMTEQDAHGRTPTKDAAEKDAPEKAGDEKAGAKKK